MSIIVRDTIIERYIRDTESTTTPDASPLLDWVEVVNNTLGMSPGATDYFDYMEFVRTVIAPHTPVRYYWIEPTTGETINIGEGDDIVRLGLDIENIWIVF